jgi:HEAT repeat protein
MNRDAQRSTHALVFAVLAVAVLWRGFGDGLHARSVINAASLCVAALLAYQFARERPGSVFVTMPLLLVGWFGGLFASVGAASILLVARVIGAVPAPKTFDEESAATLSVSTRRSVLLETMLNPRAAAEERTAAADAVESLVDPAPSIEHAEASALADIAPSAPRLLEVLKDRIWEVRRTAVITLGHLRHQPAGPALLEVFRDEDENADIRSEAALALGRLGMAEAVPDLTRGLGDETLEHHCGRALRMMNRGVPELVAMLDSTEGVDDELNESTRTRALRSLGNLGDPFALQPLLTAAAEGKVNARVAAVESLGGVLRRVRSAPIFTDGYHPNAAPDIAAWEKLWVIVRPAMEPLLYDRASKVRVAAVFQFEWPIEVLTKLTADADVEVRATATGGLERFGEAAISRLQTILRDDVDEKARARAAQTIYAIPDPRAIDILLPALADSSRDVRSNVAKALARQVRLGGQEHERRVIEALERLSTDADEYVRRAGEESIQEIVTRPPWQR